MCYNIALLQNKWNRLEKRYGKKNIHELPDPEQPSFFVSGFDHPDIPIVTDAGLVLASWGLIPRWCKTEKDALSIRQRTLNAKSETAAEKPSFRESWQHHRCIIPVSGFYEWHQFAGQKYPIYVKLKETEIFSLAGLISEWKNPLTESSILSCSILTSSANEVMSIIHNSKKRMPLILPEPMEETWLENGITSHPNLQDVKFEISVCSQKLNHTNIQRNQSWALQQVEYPELVFSELPIS
jgi:putative SOS response-associated peptidase YedK